MPRCPTFKNHCKYRAHRPGQSPASPPTSSASCQHLRQSLHHQHLGVPASFTSPASPAWLKTFKTGPLRVGFGGKRTWRTSLRSSGRFFLPKCAAAVRKTSRIPCFFLHFSTAFCGAGTGCRDAFFGLVGFRCETRAARARAPDASAGRRHTCAQARVGECVLSVRGVGQATLQLLRVGSQQSECLG